MPITAMMGFERKKKKKEFIQKVAKCGDGRAGLKYTSPRIGLEDIYRI
jgi:hypothetical protein